MHDYALWHGVKSARVSYLQPDTDSGQIREFWSCLVKRLIINEIYKTDALKSAFCDAERTVRDCERGFSA